MGRLANQQGQTVKHQTPKQQNPTERNDPLPTESSSKHSEQLECRQGHQLKKFPSGKPTLDFEEFIDVIKDSCAEASQAENYLVHAFGMFDVEK